MCIFIVGGTGFIGYHTVLECLRREHTITVLALPPVPVDDLLPPQVAIKFGNLNALPDADVCALLRGHEAVVYVAGADDRVTPKAPAHSFFYTFFDPTPSYEALGYGRCGLDEALAKTVAACLRV